jgi:hypothetical protein
MSAYAYALLHFFRFLIGLGLSWKDFRPPHALVFLKHLRSATARRPTQRLGLAVVPRTGRGVTGLAPESINRVLAAVSSFYEYLILSGQLHERDNPIQVRLDPALARVSERHRPALGAPGTAADLTVAWSSARQSSPHQMRPRVGRKAVSVVVDSHAPADNNEIAAHAPMPSSVDIDTPNVSNAAMTSRVTVGSLKAVDVFMGATVKNDR